jgi:hypothetical protein
MSVAFYNYFGCFDDPNTRVLSSLLRSPFYDSYAVWSPVNNKWRNLTNSEEDRLFIEKHDVELEIEQAIDLVPLAFLPQSLNPLEIAKDEFGDATISKQSLIDLLGCDSESTFHQKHQSFWEFFSSSERVSLIYLDVYVKASNLGVALLNVPTHQISDKPRFCCTSYDFALCENLIMQSRLRDLLNTGGSDNSQVSELELWQKLMVSSKKCCLNDYSVYLQCLYQLASKGSITVSRDQDGQRLFKLNPLVVKKKRGRPPLTDPSI